MRIPILILSACFFLTGCDTSTQPPKPSPLHYARVVSRQCALGCCRRRHRLVTHSVRKSKLHPH